MYLNVSKFATVLIGNGTLLLKTNPDQMAHFVNSAVIADITYPYKNTFIIKFILCKKEKNNKSYITYLLPRNCKYFYLY